MSDPRTYQLLIRLRRPVTVVVGALGERTFAAGDYLYTGSARRNLEARIARHLSWGENPQRKRHWHVDYLLAVRGVQVVQVQRFVEPECAVNQGTPGSFPVPGFGASDCRAGCISHLKRQA